MFYVILSVVIVVALILGVSTAVHADKHCEDD